jgi:HSP20 family molecular chaperone IbpA
LRELFASSDNQLWWWSKKGFSRIMSTGASSVKQASPSEMPAIVSGEKKSALLQEYRKNVSKRAYELFEERGRVDGEDVSHWLRAEGELCIPLPEVHQSGAWYTVSAPLVGVPADHIKVSVEDGVALIAAESASDREARKFSATFYAVRWPENVNPETASAYLKNGTLTLVARKAGVTDAAAARPVPQATGKQRGGSKRNKR